MGGICWKPGFLVNCRRKWLDLLYSGSLLSGLGLSDLPLLVHFHADCPTGTCNFSLALVLNRGDPQGVRWDTAILDFYSAAAALSFRCFLSSPWIPFEITFKFSYFPFFSIHQFTPDPLPGVCRGDRADCYDTHPPSRLMQTLHTAMSLWIFV